jgi:3-oxoacyl-[acyl-carrier protein] reductase
VTVAALVTGGSRGIGAAIVRVLCELGHPVVLNYRSNHDAAEATRAALVAGGADVTLWPCDVSDHTAVNDGIEKLLGDAGMQIGIVVNNAGVVADGLLPTLDFEAWSRVTRTTLDGFYNVVRPLIMPMARRRWGRVINIASVSGVVGNPGQTNYSAAKAGLIGATRSLALEFARRGITVNAIAPGLIETEMLDRLDKTRAVAQIPMRRLGKPEEVAALVRFLVSDDAGYITGQVIGVSGGLA